MTMAKREKLPKELTAWKKIGMAKNDFCVLMARSMVSISY
jgi:hypothetical protein